jgi:hypothetical protein
MELVRLLLLRLILVRVFSVLPIQRAMMELVFLMTLVLEFSVLKALSVEMVAVFRLTLVPVFSAQRMQLAMMELVSLMTLALG